MKKLYEALVAKWKAETPILYKWVIKISATIAGLTVAVNEALDLNGAVKPDWFVSSYFYIIGITAGIAFLSKFTEKKQ